MGQTNQTKLISTILVISIALIVKVYWNYYNSKFELLHVIQSMENIEISSEKIERIRTPRIAIGFGGCTDYFTRAIACLRHLNLTEPNQLPIDNIDQNELNNIGDINQQFSKFFMEGAAAERYVNNKELFETIYKSVVSLKDLTKSYLGGNAPVMANRLAQDGANVLLGTKLSKYQMSFLHSNVSVVEIAGDNASEDRHIILEFDVGENWGSITCPRANRFIIHRDKYTPFLNGLEEMDNQIKNFKPDIFVLGGLQMMDGFPYKDDEMKHQINKLEKFLAKIPGSIPIHFEMASFVDKKLFLMLKNQIIPYSDSLGFNEQELPNLVSILDSNSITTLSDAYPRTSQMLDHMRRVWEILVDQPVMNVTRHRLSRLHLHTIGYQIIMTNKHSKFWYSSRSSVAKASLVAYRHTCGIHNVDIERSKLLMDDSFSISRITNSPRVHFNSSEPVSCWEEREVEICVAPVLVCTKVIKTVGGGDNISSAALLNQLKVEE